MILPRELVAYTIENNKLIFNVSMETVDFVYVILPLTIINVKITNKGILFY
jgi:hypothetical protein